MSLKFEPRAHPSASTLTDIALIAFEIEHERNRLKEELNRLQCAQDDTQRSLQLLNFMSSKIDNDPLVNSSLLNPFNPPNSNSISPSSSPPPSSQQQQSNPLHHGPVKLPPNCEYLQHNTIIRLANKKVKKICDLIVGDKILSLCINSYPKQKRNSYLPPIQKPSANNNHHMKNSKKHNKNRKKSLSALPKRPRSRTIQPKNMHMNLNLNDNGSGSSSGSASGSGSGSVNQQKKKSVSGLPFFLPPPSRASQTGININTSMLKQSTSNMVNNANAGLRSPNLLSRSQTHRVYSSSNSNSPYDDIIDHKNDNDIMDDKDLQQMTDKHTKSDSWHRKTLPLTLTYPANGALIDDMDNDNNNNNGNASSNHSKKSSSHRLSALVTSNHSHNKKRNQYKNLMRQSVEEVVNEELLNGQLNRLPTMNNKRSRSFAYGLPTPNQLFNNNSNNPNHNSSNHLQLHNNHNQPSNIHTHTHTHTHSNGNVNGNMPQNKRMNVRWSQTFGQSPIHVISSPNLNTHHSIHTHQHKHNQHHNHNLHNGYSNKPRPRTASVQPMQLRQRSHQSMHYRPNKPQNNNYLHHNGYPSQSSSASSSPRGNNGYNHNQNGYRHSINSAAIKKRQIDRSSTNYLESVQVTCIFKTKVFKLIEISTVNNIRIRCTQTQLFWICGKGWGCLNPKKRILLEKQIASMKNKNQNKKKVLIPQLLHALKNGEKVLTVSGKKYEISNIRFIEKPKGITVFSIIVNKNQCFFANDILCKNSM